MAVDLNLGPHSGGCAVCSGVVTVDATDSSVPYTVRYNSEYYEIGHFSALMPPMSTRITSTLSAAGRNNMQALAATTPDKSTVVQITNEGTSAQAVFVVDKVAGTCFTTTLAAQSLTSFKWGSPASQQPPLLQQSGAGMRGASWMGVGGLAMLVWAVLW